MSAVRLLPSDLINQIAAGEVVERPASVVKELVENALDAGATKVRVEIVAGGVSRMHVTDDGTGMDEADARLALERHATSKIASLADLGRIASFGFRGEALPSIASVSRFKLRTRLRGRDEGVEVALEGGGEAVVRPTGCAAGTHVEVSDLFFNVPARRKFLKATATESGHVGDVVALAALSAPGVGFTLCRDGKVVRELTRAGSRKERVAQVIQEDRLEACVREQGPLRIEAYLAPPERARAGAVTLHVFVNGRPVRDRQLARAVAQAYGSVLEGGRYPVGVVFLDLPPDLVDVNVHPQKAEVRFADARAVWSALTRQVHSALAVAFSLSPSQREEPWFHSAPSPTGPSSPLPAAQPSPAPGVEMLRDMSGPDPWQLRPTPAASPAPPYTPPEPVAALVADGADVPLFGRTAFYGKLRYVGQVRATFLVTEGPDGLYILDQHAAAERVTFDRLRADYAGRAVASQRLLVPEVVALAPAEYAVAEEYASEALGLGLDARPMSGSAVAVYSVPSLLPRASPERLVRDLVAEVGRTARRPFSDSVDRVLATMACHGSVRAGDILSPEEARELLVGLDAVSFAAHCPHGRPIVMRLGFDELERKVGR